MADDDQKPLGAPRRSFDIGEEELYPAKEPEPPPEEEEEVGEDGDDDLADEPDPLELEPSGDSPEFDDDDGEEGEAQDGELLEEEPSASAPPPIEDRFGAFRLGHQDIPLVAKDVQPRDALGSMFIVLQAVAADKNSPPRSLPQLFHTFGPDYRFSEQRPGVIHYAMLNLNLRAGTNEIGSILDQPAQGDGSEIWPAGKLEGLAERLKRGGLYSIVLS